MRTLIEMSQRWRPPSREPVLSVVVPVYNVAPYLAECLDSLLGQTLKDIEIVVVDDGSTDDSPAILRQYAGRHRRIRTFRQANAGPGAARNAGVRQARGEFLTFVDADDTVPPTAFERLVATLRRSGSDFCVGRTRRMSAGAFSPVGWSQVTHDRDRIGITIDDFPLALRDVLAGNRVFKRQFWVDRVPPFEPYRTYEDHVPMLMAYVRARSFDLIAASTYNWRIRQDGTSTSQGKSAIASLRDRIAVKEQAHEFLAAEASQRTYDAWVARCIATDFASFVRPALAGTAEYRDLLSETYRTFFARASSDALAGIRPRYKVVGWLVGQGHWEDVGTALDLFESPRAPLDRTVEGDRIRLVPPTELLHAGVPEEMWLLARHEVRVAATLRGLSWRDDGTIELVGSAALGGLHPTDELQAEVNLFDLASATSHPVPVDITGQTLRATVPVIELPAGHWSLLLTLRHRALSATDRIPKIDGAIVKDALQPRTVGPVEILPHWSVNDGLVLEVRR
ncbi:glycosyltransferase family 2 protein [Nocardioides sp. SYSU DS0651]|uniref:glycosyltransferase family 2 protein n=1 Tax=Nocardioides sp. SYSU DS0651 TaxID=3415955 RepID=UPI003F4B94B3